MALFSSREPAETPAPEQPRRAARTRQAVDTVEDMRRRARHRLIGACLLVVVGIIVFPVLFDTQPRPVPVNAQVDIPGVDSAPPLVVPVQVATANRQLEGLEDGEEVVDTSAASASSGASVTASSAGRAGAASGTGTGTSAPAAARNASSNAQEASRQSTPSVAQNAARASQREAAAPREQKNEKKPEPRNDQKTGQKTEQKPDQKPEQKQEQKPDQKKPATQTAQNTVKPPAATNSGAAAKPVQPPAQTGQGTAAKPEPAKPAAQVAAASPPPPVRPPASNANDSARARALLEGRPVDTVVPSRAEQGRFIVQVGVFSDDAKVRDTRARLERLGLKTYTQVVQTPNGRATRVRVGPFGSRDDADKAAGRIKGENLPTIIIPM